MLWETALPMTYFLNPDLNPGREKYPLDWKQDFFSVPFLWSCDQRPASAQISSVPGTSLLRSIQFGLKVMLTTDNVRGRERECTCTAHSTSSMNTLGLSHNGLEIEKPLTYQQGYFTPLPPQKKIVALVDPLFQGSYHSSISVAMIKYLGERQVRGGKGLIGLKFQVYSASLRRDLGGNSSREYTCLYMGTHRL